MNDEDIQKLEEKINKEAENKYWYISRKTIKPNMFLITGVVLGFIIGLFLIPQVWLHMSQLPKDNTLLSFNMPVSYGSVFAIMARGLIMLPFSFALFGGLFGLLVKEIIKKLKN